MRRTATTSLEAFYSTPARSLQDKEKRVMAAFTSPDAGRKKTMGTRMSRVRSLLDKSALAVRGEAKCSTTGKYRELLGLPEGQE